MAAQQNNPPEKKNNSKKPRSFFPFWLYAILAGFFFFQIFTQSGSQSNREITWNKFEQDMLVTDEIDHVDIINKEKAEIYLKKELLGSKEYVDFKENDPGPHYYMIIGSVESFETKVQAAKEKYSLASTPEIKYVTRKNWLTDILAWTLPFLIIIAFWLFILKRTTGGGMGKMNPFDFGKSKPTLHDINNKSKLTFKDVAGLEEAKVEVNEVVNFLKNPGYYSRLGAKIPKGVMLVGPPGTGKTLLAKAVAGEANVPFFHMSGSEFVEMFVGVGASRVRDLFKQAKEKAPSIIFIDEIDAIGRMRGGALSMRSNDERESTLNQLLTEMDGFGTNSGVIILAATIRPGSWAVMTTTA